MKKSWLIAIVGTVVAYLGCRVFFSKSTKQPLGDVEYQKVKALYKGADLVHTGLATKAGDIIEGDLRSDGYLKYEMWGNGIIASSHTFLIAPKDFEVINDPSVQISPSSYADYSNMDAFKTLSGQIIYTAL